MTGFGLSRPKVVCGRGVFVLPIVQRADRLNMRLLKIDVKTPETGVKTKEGVSLWLDSVVTVQVYSENSTVSDEEVRNAGYDDIRKYINSRQQAAISNFLGMDEAHINEKINDVLQGNLREIVSEMTVDQILTNRKQMAVSVVENARPDLAKMGLEVVTFNVQDVKDAVDAMGHNHGVIEAIGVEQEELVKKRASIAKAEAERDVSCAKAAAAMAANEKEIEAQTAIAQRNNELELAKSKLKAEADKAAADANAAGMIQTNLRAKEVKESEADAEIARQKKMVDLAAQEAEVQQRKQSGRGRTRAARSLPKGACIPYTAGPGMPGPYRPIAQKAPAQPRAGAFLYHSKEQNPRKLLHPVQIPVGHNVIRLGQMIPHPHLGVQAHAVARARVGHPLLRLAEGQGVLGQHVHDNAAVGHAGGLLGVGAQHVLKHLHQHRRRAVEEHLPVLRARGHRAARRVHPLGKLRVLHQLLHGAALKLAKGHLPQVVQLDLPHAGK